ncbi:serine hydrolase domain-containing protein [Steroidobacter sp.]|uniref:serine hydrolase domain-containing protein n=1 Tax=Steroidobacter sp. TaxID=1978227 RepID=UPI001A3B688A|nr:serine hydrolase [Steroidobacter sp.]MBL8271292.1 serine hydrolase [Steroidobacter sp.]
MSATAPDAEQTRLAYSGRLMPDRQLLMFRNQGWAFAQRRIARGASVRSLPLAASQLEDVAIISGGAQHDLFDYVSRNRVAGLLILHRGQVIQEHYEFGNDAHTPWISMSIAKSISTTLLGAALRDGLIRSLDDQLTRYLPVLKSTGYDGVTLRQLLQMTSGLSWNETHSRASTERRNMLELQIAQRPGCVLDYLTSRPRIAEPGTEWVYGTGDAHIVGVLLRAVTGAWLSDYLAEKIWSRIGMEHDATWWLEAPDALEVAGSGINATLRDYARFGEFFRTGGIVDGASILPENWLRDATSPRVIAGKRVDYGYMWWPVAGRDGSFTEGAFSARGIFGQYLYINPARELVIVSLSARAKPRFSEGILDNDFFNSVADALR